MSVTTYRCVTHNVRLTIDGDNRVISMNFWNQCRCHLLVAPNITVGQHGECQIVEEVAPDGNVTFK